MSSSVIIISVSLYTIRALFSNSSAGVVYNLHVLIKEDKFGFSMVRLFNSFSLLGGSY